MLDFSIKNKRNRNSGARDLSISRDNEDGPKTSTKRIVLNQSANVNLNFKQKSFGPEQYSILTGNTNYNISKTPKAEKSKEMSNENPVNQFSVILFLY